MSLVLVSLFLYCSSALLAPAFNDRPSRARAIGVSGAVLASLAGLIPAVGTLVSGSVQSYSLNWSVPMGSVALRLDPLSALFLLPVFALTLSAAVYGAGYFKPQAGRAAGLPWTAFNLLAASMCLVFLSANAVLFMLSWEAMAVSSFFLVIFEHARAQARKAAYIYLVAGGAGALALLLCFSLLSAGSPVMDFDGFSRPAGGLAAAAFLSALLGFGLKAGVIPLHVWLPEAHPAAPSHVSAVMSGVMIKTGIYGLVRVLSFLSPWEAWWGPVLTVLGIISAVLGVVFALSQHDIKRLLAYSSVENIGIILMAFGLGMTGAVSGMPGLAALAFAGGLLHAVNHSMFKGLLFMGAGAVIHGAGSGELEALGGLGKRMPVTAALFAAGAASISALPPFNGFVGEFLVYLGSFRALDGRPDAAFWAIMVILTLSLAGALAAACLVKVFGAAFLGEPRSAAAAGAREPGRAMLAGMALPAAACLLIGVFSPFLLDPLASAVSSGFARGSGLAELNAASLCAAEVPLWYVCSFCLVLALLAGAAAAFRSFLLRNEAPAETGTWDCGYAAPSARMQYGASSFTQPLTSFFQPLLRTSHRYSAPEGLFPAHASFQTETRALFYNNLYTPAAGQLKRLAYKFSWLQHGRLQLYILYIVATLMALLLWKL